MDLVAYVQIEDLKHIAEANGIEVPRLRGYRLMSEEEAVTPKQIEYDIHNYELHCYDWACCAIPRFHPDSDCHEFSPRTDRIRHKYLIREIEYDPEDGAPRRVVTGFRWDLVHGKNRKAVKFAIKKGRKAVARQHEVFNKYAGREDVLYIHARIGGGNWWHYGGAELEKQPWFLEKVDDYFDGTYCDIYALIDRSKCDGKESND